MKKYVKTRKTHCTFGKRAAAFALAAVSCCSLAAMPKSEFGGGLLDAVSITASAATIVDYENAPKATWFSTNMGGGTTGNQTLKVNKWYSSPNKKYAMVFQSDGNLVLYHQDQYKNRLYDPVWSSGTKAPGAECIFQADGNLVIYYTDAKGRRPVWHSHTYGHTGQVCYLKVSDAGEITIGTWYNPYKIVKYTDLWTTKPVVWPYPHCLNVSKKFDGRNIEISTDPYKRKIVYGTEIVAPFDGSVRVDYDPKTEIKYVEVIGEEYIARLGPFIRNMSSPYTGLEVKKGQLMGYASANTVTFELSGWYGYKNPLAIVKPE